MKGTIAFIPESHKLEFFQHDVPDPLAGGVVAEVTQTNVCGSEVHMWKGEVLGRRGVMPGHEMSGIIHALGQGVSKDWAGVPVKVGDRIAPVYYTVCNRCDNCVAGNHAGCVSRGLGVPHPDVAPHFTATFATHYFIKPDQHFYRIPDNVPDLIAASANCAMSQVYWALDRGRLSYGEKLLVLGAGGLGLHAMAIAKARGARVIAIDGVDLRLAQARRFGADEVIDLRQYPDLKARQARVRDLAGARGPDVVLEVAGNPEAFVEAVNLVRNGGRLIEVGNISGGLAAPLAPSLITTKSIDIHGVVTYPPHYLKKTLDFLAQHISHYPYLELCDARFPLSRAAEALDKSERKEVIRAALFPGQQV
ncbi:MAG TPA: zinc-binding dehydrogenase [Candidatus Binataceae bacterium]|nr:zinc-binding dehydrogenase [Candidatus Binataceae bacterium]